MAISKISIGPVVAPGANVDAALKRKLKNGVSSPVRYAELIENESALMEIVSLPVLVNVAKSPTVVPAVPDTVVADRVKSSGSACAGAEQNAKAHNATLAKTRSVFRSARMVRFSLSPESHGNDGILKLPPALPPANVPLMRTTATPPAGSAAVIGYVSVMVTDAPGAMLPRLAGSGVSVGVLWSVPFTSVTSVDAVNATLFAVPVPVLLTLNVRPYSPPLTTVAE